MFADFIFRLRGLWVIYSRGLVLLCLAGLIALASSTARAQQETLKPLRIETGHSYLIKTRVPVIRASIADPETADVRIITPDQVLVVANPDLAGTTTLILWQDEQQVVTVDVQVYTTVSETLLAMLRDRLEKIAPGVEVEIMPAADKPDNGTVLITGETESQALLDRVVKTVNAFDFECVNLVNITGPQQVQLKVVIAEVSKSGAQQMGLNFAGSNSDGSLGILYGDTWEGSFPGDLTLYSPFSSAFGILMAADDWAGIIALLKSQGLSKYLATPTLVAMSGQSASFQVGGSYPIPMSGDDGQVTIEQQEYGIILNFTPYVIDGETITLEVSPEVSSPDFSLGTTSGGTTVPGLATREASTTLQLKNGQTFAMAGLLKEENYVTINKVPFLGDIPYLGTLFTSKETENTEVELVIMVTPQIVRPLNRDEVPLLPGQTTANKISDTDFFLKNKMDLPAAASEIDPVFKGEIGFAR